MKISDIIKQLIGVVPRYTTVLSSSVSVSSITRSGTTVTVVTSTAHGKSTGNSVLITGAQTPVEIATLTRSGTVLSGTTSQDHDLTEGYQSTIRIDGANEAGFNDEFELLTVDNRREFTAKCLASLPASGTGDMLLYDGKDRGYNGEHVITVVDATTFTFEIDDEPLDLEDVSEVKVHSQARVMGSITMDRFLELYTQKSGVKEESWFVVVMDDTTASSNIYVASNDAVDTYAPMSEYRQQISEKFSVFMVLPSKDEVAAMDAKDLVEDLKGPLFKSILGVKFPTYLNSRQPYGTVLVDHGFYGYTGAYYVHEFKFEQVALIVTADVVEPDVNVAFRDISLRLQNDFGRDIMTSEVNLDRDPLP